MLCRMALVLLPFGALAIMADQRWLGGYYSPSIALITLVPLALVPVGYAFLHQGTRLHQAFEMDERGALKDRISSAWEFLSQESLTREQELQVRDAIRTAYDTDLASLVRLQNPRMPYLALVVLGVFIASFFVPATYSEIASAPAPDAVRDAQLAEVAEVREEIEALAQEERALADIAEKLREIEQNFARNEMDPRDVMIELARLDLALHARMEAAGLDEVSSQLDQAVPHLMASEPARPVAEAIRENRHDEAARAMEQLARELNEGSVSSENREQLAQRMANAAAAMRQASGDNESGGLIADFDAASKSVGAGDKDGVSRSFQSIQGKMQQCNGFQAMKDAANSLAMGKMGLGAAGSMMARRGDGQKPGQGQGQGEDNRLSDDPSTSAGRGEADPLGDARRLDDSYREMLQVRGTAGDGPVASEVEMTEGQMAPSQRTAREVYNEYAGVAEQALDREDVPLSHRFHVKRYFQAIRPTE